MTERVNPVPLAPPRLGLIASAVDGPSIDGNNVRWENGLAWVPDACDPALGFTFDPCVDASFDSDPMPETGEFQPVGIGVGVECSTLGPFTDDELRSRAQRALNAHAERLIGNEFWTGTAATAAGFTNNVSLDQATDVLTASTPLRALARLEQHAADNGAGGRAFIHARPQLVTYWAARGVLRREGNLILTVASDSIVVPSEGYPGTGPSGEAAADDTQEYAYVTSTVALWRSTVDVVGPAVDEIYTDNHRRLFASQLVAVTFDPCVHAAVLVDLCDSTDQCPS